MRGKARKTLTGYLFFAPFGLFYIIFLIYPIFQALILGFYKWDIFGAATFSSLDNFEKMFADGRFWASLWHTVYFTILTVPPLVILGFSIGLLLYSRIYFRKGFRMLTLLPFVLSISVVCTTWAFLFQPEFGFFNQALQFLGIPSISWLGTAKYAMPSIAMTTIWWTVGFNVILYLAGLQQISPTFYEAAIIDGAGPLQRLWHITVPLLRRTHALVIVLQIIASLKIFGQVYIMTNGGPHGSTRVLVQYIYENAFRYFKMGYAQAMAVVLFFLMFVISVIQFKLIVGKGESL